MRATVDFPSVIAAEVRWILTGNTEAFESTIADNVFTAEGRKGQSWSAEISFMNLTAANAAILDAFMAQLEGIAGRFTLGPLHRELRIANGVVNGAGQSGKTLAVSGYTPAETLYKGAFIQVGTELKMLTADALVDGSGNATLSIAPMWRASPADGAVVNGQTPTTVMRLKENMYTLTALAGFNHDRFTIHCLETFS